MHLWYGPLDEWGLLNPTRSAKGRRPGIGLGIGLFLFSSLNGMTLPSSPAAQHAASVPVQQSGKASSPHVGSAMAVLATLEQAHVLPPEGTKEADRIIKSVIQLQSLFTTSTDPSVQDFLRRAVASRGEEQVAQVLAQFQSGGWTPDVLEALSHAAVTAPQEELQSLTAGLGSFNLSVEDFRQFMQLVKEGAQALASDGRNFHEAFASHRKMMPGAARH